MTPLSIRWRLSAVYLAVLAAATLALAGGASWLLRTSVESAADANLATRVDSTRRFIEAIERALPPEDLVDEFGEFAELTRAESLLEVIDDRGRVLCAPTLPGWSELRRTTLSPSGSLVAHDAFVDAEAFRAVATDLIVGGRTYRVHAAVAMDVPYGALNRFARWLALLVPAVLVLAAAGGFWISGRALAPVDRMTRDVQSISWQHLDRRLTVPAADDELRRLAVTFNVMLQRLQQSVADIVRFTADAAHELRTPVTLARTSAEIALARERSPGEYRLALAEVLGHTERMSALVEDLLSLARADAGVEPVAATVIDLREAVQHADRDVRAMLTSRSLRWSVDVPNRAVPVRTSVESARRLLLILIDNAAKYTPAGGEVHVRVVVSPDERSSGPSAVVEVVDSGCGIRPEEAPRVFDRFYRGMVARACAPDGSGLGLSIARAIVERHHGTIDVVPRSGVSGCCARVRLPLAAE